jgi:NAD+ diphosphatase
MPAILNAPPHVYAARGLDRAAERRRDETWLADRRGDPATRLILCTGLLVPIGGAAEEPRLAAPTVAELDRPAGADAIFLGMADGIAWFVESVPDATVPGAQYVELRSVGTLLPADEAAALAYARALLHWHTRSSYCSVCGNATMVMQGGHVRRCVDCGADHFPRTDPAVIVLVTDGERCLLGRSARFVSGMYSTLAGFVEPGESLEETIYREVLEESGIEVEAAVYRSSQPWPFPQSLMLGFRARARTFDIRIDPEELEDARWLTRSELRDPERRPVRLPNHDSIARFLIEEWLAEEG